MDLKQKGNSAALGAFNQLKISLIWSSAVDLDLMAFYKTKDNQVGGVYSDNYSGGNLGNLNQFPFMQLSGDAGVGATGGDNREEMRITNLDKIQELYIVAVNFTDASSNSNALFSKYDARVEVETDRGEVHVIKLDSNSQGSVAVLCKVSQNFMGTQLANDSNVISFEQFKQIVPGASSLELLSKVPIEKKLASYGQDDPGLLKLAKKAEMTLKQKGLGDHVAAVALVMDVSGSMSSMFRDGTVQKVIERIMGLGLNFDDNGAIDIFAFQSTAYDLGELTPDRFKDAAKWILNQVSMGGTNYAPAIYKVLEHYGYNYSTPTPPSNPPQKTGFFSSFFGSKNSTPPSNPNPQGNNSNLPAEQPVYVLFVTDGDCSDKDAAKEAIKKASHFPIFFQFVGIGGASFSFLDHLDNMSGRFIDNANFFEVQNPNSISEQELYSKMMDEYPDWLNLAKSKNLL